MVAASGKRGGCFDVEVRLFEACESRREPSDRVTHSQYLLEDESGREGSVLDESEQETLCDSAVNKLVVGCEKTIE
jgi:hypothetical protein